jgi:CheY-like chemotaxis protein
MGGDIRATSQIDKGSTFSLTVPLRRPTLVPGISTSKEEESFGDILQKRHVLIASNHSPSAQDLSLTVKRLGGTASRTRVSESTTAMVNDKKPNILMLWFTPYSGDEAMMASVAMARAMMPVIALTDSDDDEVRTRALLHGADDCLSAPGDFQTAAEVIKKAVNTTLGEKTAAVLDALSKLYGYEPEILSVAIESTIEQLRTEALALANTPADDIDTIRRHINTLAVNARSGGLHSLFKIINDQEADLEQMDVATLSSFLNTVVQETALWMPHLKYALRAVYSPQQSH